MPIWSPALAVALFGSDVFTRFLAEPPVVNGILGQLRLAGIDASKRQLHPSFDGGEYGGLRSRLETTINVAENLKLVGNFGLSFADRPFQIPVFRSP